MPPTLIFFLSLLVDGALAGALYALIALAFVLVYKSSRMVNFALGEWIMTGATLAAAANPNPIAFWPTAASVAPVMIPTPLLSNSAVELDAPVNSVLEFDVIALPKPGLEHAVDKATPLEEPEFTPGVASGVAPKGIPVGAPAVPEVLMPRGEVVPIPELGLATPPIPELAVAPPSALTCA